MTEPGNDLIQQQYLLARRNQILDAATQVFAQKGFHRATIREIARSAGVADGTIYTYFANKAALLTGILDRVNQTAERRTHFNEGSVTDLRSFLSTYMQQRLSNVMAQLEVLRALLPEVIADPELRAIYYQQTIEPTIAIAEQFLSGRMASGELRPLDVAATIRALTGMVVGVLMLRLLGDPYLEEEWSTMPQVLTAILCDGLMHDGGQDDHGA